MTMTKHTDGAVKAAVEVIRELRLLVPSGDINAPKGTLAIKGTEIDLKDIAAIIDQETAAPDLLQLFAERDRLRAEKAELVEAYEMVQGMLTSHQRMNLAKYEDNKEYRAIKVARALLAKVEPVEGTEDL